MTRSRRRADGRRVLKAKALNEEDAERQRATGGGGEGRGRGRGEGERATTLSSQTTGQRAGSVHLVEKLCSFFLLDIQKLSWRASGHEGPRGIGVCARHIVREHDTTQPVLNKDIKRAHDVPPSFFRRVIHVTGMHLDRFARETLQNTFSPVFHGVLAQQLPRLKCYVVHDITAQ